MNNRPIKRNKEKFFSFHLLALGFVLAVSFASCISNTVSDSSLKKLAETLNKRGAVMVDDITCWDNTEAHSGKILQYNYTLVNVEAKDIDASVFKKQLQPILTHMVDSIPDMKIFRDNDVTFVYAYKDKNGNSVQKITILPKNK